MLISWLSARQHAPEGGFAGRTNKLIDGCYSHWVGGCWPLIEAAINGPKHAEEPNSGSLFSREGLVRYILACCQQDTGGLRDKPSKQVIFNSGHWKTAANVLLGIQMRIIPAMSSPASAPLSITVITPMRHRWRASQSCSGDRLRKSVKGMVNCNALSLRLMTAWCPSIQYMSSPMLPRRRFRTGSQARSASKH